MIFIPVIIPFKLQHNKEITMAKNQRSHICAITFIVVVIGYAHTLARQCVDLCSLKADSLSRVWTKDSATAATLKESLINFKDECSTCMSEITKAYSVSGDTAQFSNDTAKLTVAQGKVNRKIAFCDFKLRNETPPPLTTCERCSENIAAYETILRTDARISEDTSASPSEKKAHTRSSWLNLSEAMACALCNDSLFNRVDTLLVNIISRSQIIRKIADEDSVSRLQNYLSEVIRNISVKLREHKISENDLTKILEIVDSLNTASDGSASYVLKALERAKNDPEFREQLIKIFEYNKDVISSLLYTMETGDVLENALACSEKEMEKVVNETAVRFKEDNHGDSMTSEQKDELKTEVLSIYNKKMRDKYPLLGIAPEWLPDPSHGRDGSKTLALVYDSLTERMKSVFAVRWIDYENNAKMMADLYHNLSIADSASMKPSSIATWPKILHTKPPAFYIIMPCEVTGSDTVVHIRLIEAKTGIILAAGKTLLRSGPSTITDAVDDLVNGLNRSLAGYRFQSWLISVAEKVKMYGGTIVIGKGTRIEQSARMTEIGLTEIKALTISPFFFTKHPEYDGRYTRLIESLQEYLLKRYGGFITQKSGNASTDSTLIITGDVKTSENTQVIDIYLIAKGTVTDDTVIHLTLPPFSTEKGDGDPLDIRFCCQLVGSAIDMQLHSNRRFRESLLPDTGSSISLKPLRYIPWAFCPAGVPHLIRLFNNPRQKTQYAATGIVLLCLQLGGGAAWAITQMFDDYDNDNTLLMKQSRYNLRFFEGLACGGTIGLLQGISVATLAHLDLREERNITTGYWRVTPVVMTREHTAGISVSYHF